MRIIKVWVLALFLTIQSVLSAWGMEYPPAGGLAPLPPLSSQWKTIAYQGMVERINPKHVQNVKFLFLGDPVPAVTRKIGNSTGLYGYGGLVAVRKKSIFGLVLQSVRFYLIDANGILIKFTDIDDMERERVTPEFHRVVVTVTEKREPNPHYVPPSKDKDDKHPKDRRHGRDGRHREPEYIWVTKEEVKIEPVLDAYQEERLIVFKKTRIDRQPVFQ